MPGRLPEFSLAFHRCDFGLGLRKSFFVSLLKKFLGERQVLLGSSSIGDQNSHFKRALGIFFLHAFCRPGKCLSIVGSDALSFRVGRR